MLGTWDCTSSEGTELGCKEPPCTLQCSLHWRGHTPRIWCARPGTAGTRSNASCRRWASAALGGLSVTPRTGVKVDKSSQMASHVHIPAACFPAVADTQEHPKSPGEMGFQDSLCNFAKQEMCTLEPNVEREGLKHISTPLKLSAVMLLKISKWTVIFFFKHCSTWSRRCHTHPPLKIKAGQGSQSWGHPNRLSCFLRHPSCGSCLLGGRSGITLFFSLPLGPSPCKQAT